MLSGKDKEKLQALALTPLSSTLLSGYGWHKEIKALVLQFQDGALWAYYAPFTAALGLSAAESPGTFFHERIKGRYSEYRLGQAEQRECVVATPCYLLLLQLQKDIKGVSNPAVLYRLWVLAGKRQSPELERSRELLMEASGNRASNPHIKNAVPLAVEVAKQRKL